MTFETILDRLDALSVVTERGFSFGIEEQAEPPLSFAELRSAASILAATIIDEYDVRHGERIGLIVEDIHDFIVALFAVMWAGAVPVPLPPLLNPAAVATWKREINAALSQADARRVITSEDLVSLLADDPSSRRDVLDVADLLQADGAPIDPAELTADDPAFLQFSSGSTRAPKGVLVSHGSLSLSVPLMHDARSIGTAAERSVSWLPLYHDMGLIGSVISRVWDAVPGLLTSPVRFLRDPLSWLSDIDATRATVTSAPNFAFGLVTRRLATATAAPNWDLSCLRALVCGGEPVNAAVISRFAAAFAPFGLDPTTIRPCYGAAEATVAIAMTPPGGLRIDRVDPRGLESGVAESAERPPFREIVSCGKPLPGHEIRITDAEGRTLPERHVGEVRFTGPAVTGTYVGEVGEAVFAADGLHTGDVGYLADGDLFLIGRQKDVIIINGRNIDASHVEWLVDELDGIRAGGTCAFAIPGEETDQLIIVVEVRTDPASDLIDVTRLSDQICSTVARGLSLAPSDVVLVEPGSLPKTSSGKRQRAKTRTLYEQGQLASISQS